MTEQSNILIKASAFVFDLFSRKLSEHLLYHTFAHTKTVAETAAKIGKRMKLGEEGIEVVFLAGLFHDTGYTELYRGHEEVSVRIATEFLQHQNYPAERIELIAGCIRATMIPQQPKNLLEEIVADADLAGLGRKSFFRQSDLLHLEWEKEFHTEYSAEEWIRQNIALLSGHQYFTSIAKELYGDRQIKNLRLLYAELQNIHSGSAISEAQKQDAVFPPFSLERRMPQETDSQMLFKFVSNTLMMENLSGDHKALIMIFASAGIMVLSFVGLMVSKWSGIDDRHTVISLVALPVVLVLTIFFSILALRQRISNAGSENKNSPFHLFGFFYALSYNDFDQRMKEVNDDNDYRLYSDLSREYFDQRLLVARKYRYLHIAYMTFMYGFCAVILLFFILLSLHI